VCVYVCIYIYIYIYIHTHTHTHIHTHTLLVLLVEYRWFNFELIFNTSEPEGNYVQNMVQNLKTQYFENRVFVFIVLF